MDPVVLAVVLAVMLVGVAGTVLPIVPGLPVIWLAALGGFAVDGFTTARVVVMVVLSVELAAGISAQVILPARKGLKGAVARRSMALGAVGAAVGFVVIPVVGALVGALAGVAGGEYLELGRWDRAWSNTWQLVKSFGIGVAIEVAAGLLMVITFLVAVLLTW